MPFLGPSHVVSHPGGEVRARASPWAAGESAHVTGEPAHVAVRIMLLHYLLQADGTPPSGDWVSFRELPDGLFYAASFAARAEAPLEAAFGGSAVAGGPARGRGRTAAGGLVTAGGLDAFRRAAAAAGGEPFAAADAAFAFRALPLRAPCFGSPRCSGRATTSSRRGRRSCSTPRPATACRRRTWPASVACWRRRLVSAAG